MHKADEVSEVRLVREIDDEVSEVDYVVVNETHRGQSVMTTWMRIVKTVKLMSDDDDELD